MASGSNITATGMQTMTQVVSGDVVDDTDFNNMRTNVNRLLGTAQDVTLGSGTSGSTYGWGQGGAGVSSASAGSPVLASGSAGAFKDLQDDIQAMSLFLGVSIPSAVGSDVTTSDTILAGTWSDAMVAIRDCWNARFNPVSRTISTRDTRTQNFSTSGQLNSTISLTFSSESACRAYFNGGGRVGMTSSFDGDTSSAQNIQWENKLSNLGEVFIAASNSSAGAGTQSGLGFYDLTTTAQQIVIYYGGANPYASDYIEVKARVNSTTNPTVVYLDVKLFDAGDNVIDAPLDGDVTLNARAQTPDANGSGFSFTTPTGSVGTIS